MIKASFDELTIILENYIDYNEYETWLNENVSKDRFKILSYYEKINNNKISTDKNYYIMKIKFKNKNDMVAFKLAHG